MESRKVQIVLLCRLVDLEIVLKGVLYQCALCLVYLNNSIKSEVIIIMLKVSKLKICSGAFMVLMVFQLCFFCPCTCAAGTIDDLCKAAKCGDLDKVRSLIESGVDPNQFDKDGNTPLDLAVIRGKEACVRLLLERRRSEQS